jgi:hypothetical protein
MNFIKIAFFTVFIGSIGCSNYKHLSNTEYLAISYEQGDRNLLKSKGLHLQSIPDKNLLFDSIKTKYVLKTHRQNGEDISFSFGLNGKGNIKYLNRGAIVFKDYAGDTIPPISHQYQGIILPFIDTVSINFNRDTLTLWNVNNGFKIRLLVTHAELSTLLA